MAEERGFFVNMKPFSNWEKLKILFHEDTLRRHFGELRFFSQCQVIQLLTFSCKLFLLNLKPYLICYKRQVTPVSILVHHVVQITTFHFILGNLSKSELESKENFLPVYQATVHRHLKAAMCAARPSPHCQAGLGLPPCLKGLADNFISTAINLSKCSQ